MAMELIKHPTSNADIALKVSRGHFATGHSHINYYIDVTSQKFCLSEARKVALELARNYKASTLIDTILCLDGTEVIAACMASEMTKAGYMNINQNQDINVLTPERTVGSQLIFRENTAPMIVGKSVLVLMASVSTGYTAKSAIEAIAYYGRTTSFAPVSSSATVVRSVSSTPLICTISISMVLSCCMYTSVTGFRMRLPFPSPDP